VSLDLLDVLDGATRRAVFQAARRRSWRRGEALFHEHDPPGTRCTS
jgi:hypothetical protein